MHSQRQIEAIDRSTVHRICSGQVVLTLATAVKELFENSADAGATCIDVRLKNYGMEAIEVIDNGTGVEESNFQALTLKHYTSKIKEFSDLTDISTFGFRGEALSSLCALSKLTITTRHQGAVVGTRLQFDTGGKMVSTTPWPRQVGTTVCVEDLFSTLPVRHKEFTRNIKKEFTKMLNTLTAYCLISTGIKITCSNQLGNCKRMILLSVNGNTSLRENVIELFGSKQLSSLMEVTKCDPNPEICPEFDLVKIAPKESSFIGLTGYVSSCVHGQGRCAADRQFYFINRRPCDHNKISRLVNEVYHTYNRHQVPVAILHFQVSSASADVNVTPDKRQIFLEHENWLLATLKASLVTVFETTVNLCQPVGSLMQLNKREILRSSSMKSDDTTSPPKLLAAASLASLKRSYSSTFAHVASVQTPTIKQKKLDGFISARQKSDFVEHDVLTNSRIYRLNPSDDELIVTCSMSTTASNTPVSDKWSLHDINKSRNVGELDVDVTVNNNNDSVLGVTSECDVTVNNNNMMGATSECLIHIDSVPMDKCYSIDNDICDGKENQLAYCILDPADQTNNNDTKSIESVPLPFCSYTDIKGSSVLCQDSQPVTNNTSVTLDVAESIQKPVSVLLFSMMKLKTALLNYNQRGACTKPLKRTFHATISPSDNHAAENELRKELRKDMFGKMNIIGQFNLGFIITCLGRDLFIIDQHATDEKYNFETLEKSTVLNGQKLIRPVNMQITASNECILMDNIDIFKKNGFDFLIDSNAPAGQRVLLTCIPVSRDWSFGKQDIEEMLFMLSDFPGVLCRPSRVRSMLASRACRSSVMIGTALNSAEMKKLVIHMGQIEQPWNCPHGRPTIRHLINLDMI